MDVLCDKGLWSEMIWKHGRWDESKGSRVICWLGVWASDLDLGKPPHVDTAQRAPLEQLDHSSNTALPPAHSPNTLVLPAEISACCQCFANREILLQKDTESLLVSKLEPCD